MAARADGSSTGARSRNHDVERQVAQERIVTVDAPGAIEISTSKAEQRGQRGERDEAGIPVVSATAVGA